ncbi:interleukin-17A-like [Hyla sarda]|uniref:interleukin-17A-like n=1 Tax=Hyla sarda TaxID=327740 RepID=UPI0024C2FF9F|nr:interleukin-17A-like [Hyla sarda]XP_056419998.1 interleukin-17A-like [Hyla sarda]XP_056419999.1 interleukin-17A-like [Hyla sarda]XP_056420000.1 interleukin-17A-like [Hyla sarda]
MVHPGAIGICVAVLVFFASSAFLPDDHSPNINPQIKSTDKELPPESGLRCSGKRNRRLPSSVTVNTSLIEASYMDSLVQMENIRTRSLSPWNYSLNTDPNRFPFVISEANCLHFACVDADGNENPDLISFPLRQKMMVLRREQKSCSFSYRLETVVVTVGCTCVRPMVN